MRAVLLDLLCCPECRHAPLELKEIEAEEHGSDGARQIETGYLHCSACGRFFFVEEGIPRLIGEGLAPLIDTSFPERHARAFAGHEEALGEYLDRVRARSGADATHRWNMEDVAFWERDVYGDDAAVAAMFERLGRSRRDAGGRTYPREEVIFRHIRPTLRGRTLLDLGCGLAQTTRTLAPPDEIEYSYIGAELSLAALQVNRRTMPGDFVLCSVDRLPFRPASVDCAVMLGTLHHLAEHEPTLARIIETVKPGGHVGLDEVVAKHGLRDRLTPWRSPKESAHNEFVDAEVVRATLEQHCEIVEWRRQYSAIRGPLDAALGERMRSRPWLTRAVVGADRAAIRSLGERWPIFAGSELLALGRRLEPSDTSGRP